MCRGEPGKTFFTGEVVSHVPGNETVIGFNHTDVAENEELREIVRKTVRGGTNCRTIAVSPGAAEQFRELPTSYVRYRNETVEITVLMHS